MESAETFGHFLLPLTMNKGHINVKLAERVFAVRTRYLEVKINRPERHAIRNLLGMLAFRLAQFERALNYLDEILSAGEDPENLNALANRKYMCEKLFMAREARECEQKIAKLLSLDGTEDGKRRLRHLRARSLAEQAFAYSYEPFEETITFERYRKSFDLYQQAFDLAKDSITQDEKEDWLFCSGIASYTIYTRMKWDTSRRDDRKARFQKAVGSFIETIQISKDCSLLSDSWRYLGELFVKADEIFPPIPDEFQVYMRHPEKCLEEAMHVSPDNPRIIARYAEHCKVHKALSLLTQSIDMDPSVFNIRAYYIRARIYIQLFKQIHERSLLDKAEKDLETTLKYSFTPWHLESMAEVFYYKATSREFVIRESDMQSFLAQALVYCAKAAACQDGQRRPDVHKLRGMCLCASGEHQTAILCFQRAVECEAAAHLFLDSGNLLVLEYAHVLKATTPPHPSDSPVFADMVYWLHIAAEMYRSSNRTLTSLSKLKQLPQHWIHFVKYCHDNNYNQKFETIQLAATDGSESARDDFRRHSCQTIENTGCPEESVKVRHGSFLRAERGPVTIYGDTICAENCASVEKAKGSDDLESLTSTLASGQLNRKTAASPRECTASQPQVHTPVNITGDDNSEVDTVTTSLPSDEPDESTETAGLDESTETPENIRITYLVNLKTGKTKLISTTPKSQESTTDIVANRHVRLALERPLNPRLRYDFFVIYSASALEWVLHHLLGELEGTGLKGCIKDRDFIVGKPKLQNYSDSIEYSGCTVVVITKDFEEDKNAVRGMLTAIEEDKLVLPVLREARDMPMPLKALSYLNATGAVDWPRLERSIEQQIKLDAIFDT